MKAVAKQEGLMENQGRTPSDPITSMSKFSLIVAAVFALPLLLLVFPLFLMDLAEKIVPAE